MAQFVMSPCGSRFPATPENVKAFAKNLIGKGSNEKPDVRLMREEARNDVKKKAEVDVDGEKEVTLKMMPKVTRSCSGTRKRRCRWKSS